MSSNSDIGLDIVGIGNQLKNFHFFVPRYQRSYAWKREHIEDLYKDIKSAAFNFEQNEFFLGAIVVSKKENGLEVIDGQQRLATISIFIAAIRNYYRKKKDISSAGDIERDYLFNRDFETKEELPRLKLSTVRRNYAASFCSSFCTSDFGANLANIFSLV